MDNDILKNAQNIIDEKEKFDDINNCLFKSKTSIQFMSEDYKFFYYVFNGILGALEVMKKFDDYTPTQNDCLASIQSLANLMAAHVNNTDKSKFIITEGY